MYCSEYSSSYVVESKTKKMRPTLRRQTRRSTGRRPICSYDIATVRIGCGPTTIYMQHVAVNYRAADSK